MGPGIFVPIFFWFAVQVGSTEYPQQLEAANKYMGETVPTAINETIFGKRQEDAE